MFNSWYLINTLNRIHEQVLGLIYNDYEPLSIESESNLEY